MVLNSMVRSASQEPIAVEDSAMARHATDRTPSTTEPEQRRTASGKLAYHRNLREALIKISHSPETSSWLQLSRCRDSPSSALLMPRRS